MDLSERDLHGALLDSRLLAEVYFKTVISISDYSNLWADHKRSKFEQISFEKKDEALLPIKINVHFDGRVFKLEES